MWLEKIQDGRKGWYFFNSFKSLHHVKFSYEVIRNKRFIFIYLFIVVDYFIITFYLYIFFLRSKKLFFAMFWCEFQNNDCWGLFISFEWVEVLLCRDKSRTGTPKAERCFLMYDVMHEILRVSQFLPRQRVVCVWSYTNCGWNSGWKLDTNQQQPKHLC